MMLRTSKPYFVKIHKLYLKIKIANIVHNIQITMMLFDEGVRMKIAKPVWVIFVIVKRTNVKYLDLIGKM